MPLSSSPWSQVIEEHPTLEVVVPANSFDAVARSLPSHDPEQLKGQLGLRLWTGDSPVDFETQDGDLSILVRPDQQSQTIDVLTQGGISHMHQSLAELRAAEEDARAAFTRIFDRKLRLTWKKSAESTDPAPHALDIFEGDEEHLVAVLTIKKPKGNQTMRLGLPEGTTLEELNTDWKGEWSSNEKPTNEGGVFHHIRYHRLQNGLFIVWKVNHIHDAPDDEFFIADAVPSMEQAFAPDEDA